MLKAVLIVSALVVSLFFTHPASARSGGTMVSVAGGAKITGHLKTSAVGVPGAAKPAARKSPAIRQIATCRSLRPALCPTGVTGQSAILPEQQPRKSVMTAS